VLVFAHAAVQRKIARVDMVLRRNQIAADALHDIALQQEFAELRLFSLEHFTELTKTH